MTDEKALWYVVHTYSGYENKVANDLIKTVETSCATRAALPASWVREANRFR